MKQLEERLSLKMDGVRNFRSFEPAQITLMAVNVDMSGPPLTTSPNALKSRCSYDAATTFGRQRLKFSGVFWSPVEFAM